MNDPKQAELLEQFLALLRANAHATPPQGLDPEIAAFARKLAAHPAPDAALRARVWQRALTAAQLDESKRVRLNGHRQDTLMPLKEHNSMIAAHATPSRRSTPWFTLIAAALAVTIFGFYLFNLRPNSPLDPGAFVAQQSSETPTPAATETAEPSLTPSITWTPTPVPAASEAWTPTMVPAAGSVSITTGTLWHPFVFDIHGAVRLDAGSIINGQLSPASPVAGYTFTAPSDGSFTVYVVTDQFQPLIAYSAANTTVATAATAGNVVPLTLRAGNNVTFNVTSVNGSGSGPYIVRLEPGEPSDVIVGGSNQTIPAIPPLPAESGATVISGDALVTAPPSLDAQNPTIVTLPDQGAQAVRPMIEQSTITMAQPSGNAFYVAGNAFMDFSDAQDMTPNTSIDGELKADKPFALYHFVAPATGLLNLHVQSSAIADLNIAMQFINAEQNGGGGGGGGGSSPDVLKQIGAANFVQAGGNVYIRVASASGQSLGKFTLTTSISEPKPLSFGDSAENDLNDKAPAAVYSFEANAGDVIAAKVEGRDGFDTQLQLADSQSTFGVRDDDSGDGYNPELSGFVIPHSGTYYLTVEPYNGPYGAPGHFTLHLTHQVAASLNDGPQQVAFNSKQNSALTFDAKAGETVQLVVRIPSDASAYSVQSLRIELVQNGETVTVFNRGDGRQPAARGEGGGSTLLSGPVTLPADGPVTVKVDAAGTLNQTDSLRLEVALEK